MRARGVVAAVLVTAAVGCAGGGGDDAGPETFDSTTAGDFYAPPDPLPEGKPGTLLRFEPLDEQPVTGATAYRVMYLSESVGGEPIAVTELVGTVVGAPPSETDVIFTAGASLGNTPDAFFLMVAGFAEAYPEADPALVLTETGLEVLAGVDEGCNAIEEAIGATPWADLVRPAGATTEPWASLLRENRAGLAAADSPMLIAHSAGDSGVPVFLAETMFERLCGLGQVVELRVYDEGEDHDAAAVSKAGEMFAWIDDRFAGEPAISTC